MVYYPTALNVHSCLFYGAVCWALALFLVTAKETETEAKPLVGVSIPQPVHSVLQRL